MFALFVFKENISPWLLSTNILILLNDVLNNPFGVLSYKQKSVTIYSRSLFKYMYNTYDIREFC